MSATSKVASRRKLLGGFPFISRTFEGKFKDNPFVLDADANLFIGPADIVSRDEHIVIGVLYHFMIETGRAMAPVRDLLRNRVKLLEAFAVFDEIRRESSAEEFHVFLFGTYDGELLMVDEDDELPAGPCGKSVNEIKRRFYAICARIDRDFKSRELPDRLRATEKCFVLRSKE